MINWSAVFIVVPMVILVGFCAWRQIRFERKVWTVVTAGDVNDISSFSEYASYSNEHAAHETGLGLHPPVFIRRPDGTEYQLSFRPESHVTEELLAEIIRAKSAEYEKLLSAVERHVRDCAPCRQQHFHGVNAVRLMRSPNLPLLHLSPSPPN